MRRPRRIPSARRRAKDSLPALRQNHHAITVQIDIGTVEVVRLALRGASGRSATRPTSMPKFL
jgi:hypothetical protein